MITSAEQEQEQEQDGVVVWMTPKQEKNFMETVNKAGPTQPHMDSECWEWKGACDNAKRGHYGRVSITDALGERVTWRVPKLAYLHFVGPVPPGQLVCHHCDNPKCCRPEHLYLDTHAGNMAKRNRMGRQARGVSSGMSKLDDASVADIYTSRKGTSEMAAKYNITGANVRSIRRGETWRHITNSLSLASRDD